MSPTRREVADRLERALAAITARDGALRAFTATCADAARADLGRLDLNAPLAGLIVAVKDNVAVRGLPWPAGSAARRDRIAAADSAIVQRLRAAGALVVGTLNMHEGALGATTDNAAFGRCINPWGDGLSPGGSSGGSGAAVAAGLVDVAIGTDTMGSIRLPAAYCGVFGWKPAAGMIDMAGICPLAPELDRAGPLARDPETLLRVARALGAPEPGPLDGLSFLVAADLHRASPAVTAAFESALARLAAQGARLTRGRAEPGLDAAAALKAGLLVCERDGAAEWAAELANPQSGLSPELRALLSWGRDAADARVAEARARLAGIRAALRGHLESGGFAGMLTPTVSHVAFRHADGPPHDQAWFTQWANYADLPAVSAPAGLADGLPAGLQCTAAPGREDVALAVAVAFKPLLVPCAVG